VTRRDAWLSLSCRGGSRGDSNSQTAASLSRTPSSVRDDSGSLLLLLGLSTSPSIHCMGCHDVAPTRRVVPVCTPTRLAVRLALACRRRLPGELEGARRPAGRPAKRLAATASAQLLCCVAGGQAAACLCWLKPEA
jgi:hypothetical protein